MTAVAIEPFRHSFWKSELGDITKLYNNALRGIHGFFPITRRFFRRRILESRFFQPELFLLARADDRIVGMAHAAILGEPCYEQGGVVEMLAVHQDFRKQGIGGHLLDEVMLRFKSRMVPLIDGGGSFPFSPFYATLLGGSERSGPEVNNLAALALFESRGFFRSRESLIMVADLQTDAGETEEPSKAKQDNLEMRIIPRTPDATWLDYVFRGWRLNNSVLLKPGDKKIYSRAIFALMPGLSQQNGKKTYAIFGVNTPPELRGKGWATIHLQRLKQHLRLQGAEALELHVYSDNVPAVRLYQKTGFKEIQRTIMMRKSGT
ncbi:MAG: GNAT family N-acetyltransferase [Planctomycetes bacterium]|nr:GNAT family N-acetyltransferase [Planctomycetota bacterium]